MPLRNIAGLFVLLLGLLGFASGAAAKEQQFEVQGNGQITFVMPSGNIGCIYTPAGGTDTYDQF
jgi:hypothetical protein